tara:strand:- start:3344 stop:3958 length:615 start_codon:yes stop_codon:yes gene_type:complete
MIIEYSNKKEYIKTYSFISTYIKKLISIYQDKLSIEDVKNLKYIIANKGFLEESIFDYNDLTIFNKEQFINFLFLDILPERYIFKEIITNFSLEHKFIFMLLYYTRIDKRNVIINKNENFKFLKNILKNKLIGNNDYIIFSNNLKESIDTKLFLKTNENINFSFEEKLNYAKNSLNTRFIDFKDVLLYKKIFNDKTENIDSLLR